jgi:lipopolysaccharide biosynthesis glycosyltransferase
MSDKNGYFNSGVFMVSTASWPYLAQESFRFFKNHITECIHRDQSALNATIGDRRLRLSVVWNFQPLFRYWNFENIVSPRIFHFSGFPKPWMGMVKPWADFHPFYNEDIKALASLSLPIKLLSMRDIQTENAKSDFMRNKLRNIPFRLWNMQKMLKNMEERAITLC